MASRESHPDQLVLLGHKELAEVFPDVAANTIYRWNTVRDGKRQLPVEYRRVSGSPIWTEAQIVEFAARKGLVVDQAALGRIRADQIG